MWLQYPGGVYWWENDCPIYGARPPPVIPGRMELTRSRTDSARNSLCLFCLESWASVDIVYNGFGGGWNPRGSRVVISGSDSTSGI